VALGAAGEADDVPDLSSPEAAAPAASAEARRAAVKARLIATRSDAALRAHDPERAQRLAADARLEAERTGDPLAVAHAIARSAAAHALSGDPLRARTAWRAALDHAEASGDLTALPPYVMNLATSDHALHELGDAIAGYERAAELASRLGRVGSRAAALTNLGGLLGTIGADAEALAVLEDAERAARTAGAPLYVAQSALFRAEILARRDPVSARGALDGALAGFVERGASRQHTEALLCGAELELMRGDGAAALARLEAVAPALAEAGLGARGALLEARARLLRGDLELARRAGDRASAEARLGDDGDVGAQALGVLADVHDRLGTGAGPGLRSEARTLLGRIAARIPAGLREAFLAHPARRTIATAPSEAAGAAATRGLTDASRRLLALVSRLLVEEDEQRLLETALDEAVALTRAERAFLLLRREGESTRRPEVVAARNLDRETIQKSRFRWSRSVAERVLESGEPLVTASATEDPALMGSRSVLDLGLRSILSVPVRSRSGVVGALYLDHRFEKGRFGDEDRELVQALADVIGLALRSGRLLREARGQKLEIERLYEAAQHESARKDLELHRLADALRKGAAPSDEAQIDAGGLVGRAPALHRALEIARKVAPSDLSVLVEGESGTGKELLARFVHDHSLRSGGPWVALNCGALPESILESELFGHQRGAFTGAVRDHLGVFRAATGGTVFLDEIGELPPGAQVRLLRVLQEREVQPVGASRVVKVDVRVIAATHRHLMSEVEAGRFRRDLYFRLVGATLTLPPLRERPEDVPLIATRLLARIAREPGMRAVTLGRSAIAALARHEWPGNVRELEQTLRRAVVVSEGSELEASDLGITSAAGPTRSEAHASLEREVIEQALRRAEGNRTVAAAALGISRVTLHRLTKRLGIHLPAKMGRPPSRTIGR
jgi:serine/threonine-protein kinase PknK